MKTQTNSRKWISSKLKTLKKAKLLKHLFLVHSKYNDRQIVNDKWTDCSFWYSERPQVGWISAAAWLAGGVALEEYAVEKLKAVGKDYGRCDLWFQLDAKNSFACEAKHGWVDLGDKKAKDKSLDILDSAQSDFRKHLEKKHRRLALGFVTLTESKGHLKNIDLTVKEILKSVKKEKKCDAFLWLGASNGYATENRKKGFKVKGLIILFREIRD